NAAASTSGMRGSLEQMMSQLKTAGRKEFPLIVKADVQGSLEAILGSLEKLGTEEVAARILHAGVRGISESDVTLAEGFNAAIIGFSVRANKEAAAAAKRNGIEIRYYNIIYDLVDDIKKAMSGLLAPTLRETMLGNAQILEVFNISKVGKVAGCRVTDGTVERGANVRLIRDNVVVHEGKLSTLKRFKDEVKEVQSGQECGMAFENYGDMLWQGSVHDPDLEGHIIPVPEVRMSPDLKLATIYVMPLGGRDTNVVLAALARNKKFLRGEIAHRVNLKFAPDLRFRVDERFDEAERIEKLLRTPAVQRDLAPDSDDK